MQVSDEYSRGFNDARDRDREIVLPVLRMMMGENAHPWLDENMPLDEPFEEEL